MCKILLRARANTENDFHVFRARIGRGELVHVLPDEGQFGLREVAPNFIRLDYPGIAVSAASDILEGWCRKIQIEDQGGPPTVDRYRVFSENESTVDDQGVLGARCDLQAVEPWVELVGGSVVNNASNTVVFDVPAGTDISLLRSELDQPLYRREWYVDETTMADFESGNLPTEYATFRSLVKDTAKEPKEERKEENLVGKQNLRLLTAKLQRVSDKIAFRKRR